MWTEYYAVAAAAFTTDLQHCAAKAHINTYTGVLMHICAAVAYAIRHILRNIKQEKHKYS